MKSKTRSYIVTLTRRPKYDSRPFRLPNGDVVVQSMSSARPKKTTPEQDARATHTVAPDIGQCCIILFLKL